VKVSLLRSAVCGLVLVVGSACADDSKLEGFPDPGVTSSSTAGSRVAELIDQGIAQGVAGDYGRAMATFEEVLTLDAGNKYAWFNLGYIAQAQDESDRAMDHYDRALAIDPEYTPAMYNKAILLEEQNPTEAIYLYEQIIEVNPHASTTFVRLGLMQIELGDPVGATEHFNRALALDPDLRSAVPAEFGGEPTPAGQE
jgi:tetratricopeptide (TPR) repeat protein